MTVRAAVALLVALAPALAAADEPLVLTQGGVAQYAQVVAGLEAAGEVKTVDIADATALDGALARAPAVVIAVGSKAFDVARDRAKSSWVVGAAVLGADTKGRADVGLVPLDPRTRDAAEALVSLAPGARRVLVLHAPNAAPHVVEDARAALAQRKLTVTDKAVGDLVGFQDEFRKAVAEADAVWLLTDPRLARPELVKFMVGTCAERKVPLVGFLEGMAKAGALLANAADYAAIGKTAAELAAELAKQPHGKGAAPAPRLAPGKLVVNGKTRAALGLGGALPASAQVVE